MDVTVTWLPSGVLRKGDCHMLGIVINPRRNCS
jgi:hypothetical protein